MRWFTASPEPETIITAARFVPTVAVFVAELPTLPAQAQTDAASMTDSLVEAIVYTTARPANWDIPLRGAGRFATPAYR